MRTNWFLSMVTVWGLSQGFVECSHSAEVDLAQYDPACRVQCRQVGEDLEIIWPIRDNTQGELKISLAEESPLITALGVRQGGSRTRWLVERAEPTFFVTVGSRQMPQGKPAWQKWMVFFDNPARRPHHVHRSRRSKGKTTVASHHDRLRVSVGDLSVGPFSGHLEIQVFADCDLVHVTAAVTTAEEDLAITYDAGVVGDFPSASRLEWRDTEDRWRQEPLKPMAVDRALAVRGRTLLVSGDEGAMAVFPPPHQFFFPRDLTDNLRYVWFGTDHQHLEPRFGIGIRNDKTGGGNFVPWFNAPPHSRQRLSFFLLLSEVPGEEAWERVMRYTHGDRFPALPGHLTFTSHYHMAVAVTEMEKIQRGQGGTIPEFVDVFKRMGVNMVHLAEFHGDGHQRDPGPLRLPELRMMFAECRRLSDRELLLIPGEEINTFLGLEEPGKHPGHWMSLFPRPVYWTLQRKEGQPFVEATAEYGRVYHVGSREDMMRLLERERGLAWVAHPRIKASSWTPDIFRHEDFYLADFFLGAAYKAMPADLSHSRLGLRALDLLDDMANWGQIKYMPGEVDVFKIDHTHELYGHMNINYLRLDRLPSFDEGWQPVLDVLRQGAFFVTTGEILLEDFRVQERQSGERAEVAKDEPARVRVRIRATFPLAFAEIISGDGERVYRETIDLSDTRPFAVVDLDRRLNLQGRRWVRFEAWDIAANGAFTQPVWLTP